MKLNSVPKLLLLSLFLVLFSTKTTAQEEGEPCYLAAPATITATIMGVDVLDVSWAPVAGANGYDVQMIDLLTNTVLYNNTHFSTNTTIIGHIITSETVVVITPLCENGTPGDPGIGVPEGLHIDDLVLQLDTPDNTTISTCSGSTVGVNPVWDFSRSMYITYIPFTRSSSRVINTNEVIVSVEGPSFSQFNPQPVSLFRLQQPGGASSVSATKLNQVTPGYAPGTTNWTPDPNNTDIVNTDQAGDHFFELDLQNSMPTLPNSVNIEFSANVGINSNLMISTRNCVRGNRRPSETSGGNGSLGRMSGNDPTPNETAMEARDKHTIAPRFYPNPATNQLQISGQAGLQIQVLDLTGRQRMTIELDSMQQTLDISALPSGSYIIQYFDGKASKSERLLKL